MSIFNPGASVDLNELRSNALFAGWSNTTDVSMSQLPSYYHGAPNNSLAWFRNKNFRKLRLFNEWQVTNPTSFPSSYPTVGLSSPYTVNTSTSNGASVAPRLISHNDYSVSIQANTPYGWGFQGWYSGSNGTGTLLSFSSPLILTSTSNTSQLNWYGFHVQFSGIGLRCLDGDAMVLMADGEYKKIKDLEYGELVMSGAIGDKPNTGYHNDMESYVNWNDHSDIPEVDITGSMISSVEPVTRSQMKVINNGLLKTSIDHPILVKKGIVDGSIAWTIRGAFNIEEGDVILGSNLQPITVDSVETLDGDFQMYDVRVVGNDSIAVNNVITPVYV